MVFKVAGSVTVFRLVQPANNLLSMLVQPSGRISSVTPVRLTI